MDKEMRKKVREYDKQKDKERAEQISNKLQSAFGTKKLEPGETPEWKHCDKCNGTNVKLISRSRSVMYLWGSAVLLTLIGLIIWPLLIPAVLLMLVSWVPFVLPRMKKCRDCTHSWY